MTITLEEARTWYTVTDSVHDFDHVHRVYNLVQKIGEKEGADLEIVMAAALLHDSRDNYAGNPNRKKHHLTSAIFAGEVLAGKGWPQERIEAVQHCIRTHRFRGNEEKPSRRTEDKHIEPKKLVKKESKATLDDFFKAD